VRPELAWPFENLRFAGGRNPPSSKKTLTLPWRSLSARGACCGTPIGRFRPGGSPNGTPRSARKQSGAKAPQSKASPRRAATRGKGLRFAPRTLFEMWPKLCPKRQGPISEMLKKNSRPTGHCALTSKSAIRRPPTPNTHHPTPFLLPLDPRPFLSPSTLKMRAEPEKGGPGLKNLEKNLSADGESWTYVEEIRQRRAACHRGTEHTEKNAKRRSSSTDSRGWTQVRRPKSPNQRSGIPLPLVSLPPPTPNTESPSSLPFAPRPSTLFLPSTLKMRAEPEKAGPELKNLEKNLSADGEFWTYVEEMRQRRAACHRGTEHTENNAKRRSSSTDSRGWTQIRRPKSPNQQSGIPLPLVSLPPPTPNTEHPTPNTQHRSSSPSTLSSPNTQHRTPNTQNTPRLPF